MVKPLNRIEFPEIFLGFVAPIGADIDVTIQEFRRFFEEREYEVFEIKVTGVFIPLSSKLKPDDDLFHKPRTYERFRTFIAYGNQIRRHFDDDGILASIACARVLRSRTRAKGPTGSKPEKKVYLIHQFKRKEEIELLRAVYGRAFFQVSLYSRRGARVDWLARQFAHSDNNANHNLYRAQAESIVQTDEKEIGPGHGQQVSEIFHDADVVLNADASASNVREQVNRFCRLLFGSNSISPNKVEYGMFAAKAAALRTLDLARQVGAAIFSNEGEIISLGSNEVPKADGGTYWCDGATGFDDRDYVRGYDANDRMKRERLSDVLKAAGVADPDSAVKVKEVRESQFMDALEYGRIIHAEMSAITDAARLGRALQGATLYCTTFPCHMCAKHIIAAGIDKVVFLEPYPKSLTVDLHSDAVTIEGADRGRYESFPSVHFDHFHGVSPRRYRELFERRKRKDENGNFVEWANPENEPRPIIDLKFPFYMSLEEEVLKQVNSYLATLSLEIDGIDPAV